MKYKISFEKQAYKDLLQFKRSGNKSLIKKFTALIHEIEEHPRTGTGQVEQLKHYSFKHTWSRRLTQEFRIVYEIHDDQVLVIVLSISDHYGAK